MRTLVRHFWRDELGSSASTELALVTGVTVGALFMGISDFSATVNNHFTSVANSNALKIDDLEKKKQQEQNEREAREREASMAAGEQP